MILAVDFQSLLPALPVSYLTCVLGVFALIGLLSGLVKGFGLQVLSLVKICGIVFGSAFAVGYVQPMLDPKISGFVENANTRQVIAYVLCFIALWIVLAIACGIFKRIFLGAVPGGISRLLGGIVGIVIGVIYALFVAFVIDFIAEKLFADFEFFITNAQTDPIGKFMVEQNPFIKIIELVKNIIANGAQVA